jgi:hypothetical protein
MRRTHFHRNLYLTLSVLTVAATAGAYLYAPAPYTRLFPAILMIPGALLLGFLAAAAHYHSHARHLNRLLAGKDLLAGWTVDPQRWNAFLSLNARLNRDRPYIPYFVPIPLQKPHPNGVPITFINDGVLIGDDFNPLYNKGFGLDYGPFWIEGPPASLEFQLPLPTGEPNDDSRIALRIPTAAGNEAAGVEVFNAYKAARSPKP